MKAYLNIGTNLGNLQANIDRAVNLVEDHLGCHAHRSHPVESEPWGFESDNRFCNIGIAVETELTPHELLDTLKGLEKEMGCYTHRNADGGYADRLIDIDIMAIDGVEMHTERLTVPHKHLYDRDFFLKPYMELKEEMK